MSLGQRPRDYARTRASAESAIHPKALFGYRPSMPQSLSKVVIHIIFSTKDRHPWLDANVRPRMHAYLATICRDAGAEAFRVGGVADHIHLVTTLPRTLSQADMLEGLKKKSAPRHFQWVAGTDLMGAVRPQTPHRSPRQAFGGNFG